MGKLSKLNLPAGLLKMMKSKKNRKNGSSTEIKNDQPEEKHSDGRTEEKRPDARVEEKRNDGQFKETHGDGQSKKTDHLAKSSESSNRDKSKLIYKLDRILRNEIVSVLDLFSELLFGGLDAADVERLFQEFGDVFRRLMNLPVYSDENLRPGETFIKLAFGLREEILDALVANYDLTKNCFQKLNEEARLNIIVLNNRLATRLKKLMFSFSICATEDGRLPPGASKQHAEIFELTKIVMSMNLDDKPPMTAEQFDRLVDSVVAQTKLNVKNKSGDAYEPFAQFRSVRPCEDCSGNHQH